MVKGRGNSKTPEMVVDLLKRCVAEKGQSAVARECGITQSAVHRYIARIGEPSTTTLEKLATYFKVSVQYLRGESTFTYEQERRSWDWNLLSDEEKARISAAIAEESKTEIERLRGELSVGRAKQAALEDEIEKIQSDFERYRELVIAFMNIPVKEMDDAINLLRIIQKTKI